MPRNPTQTAPQIASTGFNHSNLPVEMRLLLQCSRWPFSEQDAAAVDAAQPMDWGYFLALCAHHRLAPLVYRALAITHADAPPEVLGALKSAATANAISTLRYLAETRRLCDLLEQAGISVRVLKGVPLSQRVYADPSLRSVGDIDLLIAPGMETIADRILLAEGLRRNDPEAPLTPRRRRSWSRHGKDYTYRTDGDSFEIDLHWRLFRNPHMPGNALADPAAIASEQIHLGETAFTVLPLERSFLYLCVHGALDGWYRFKSLVDIAALWHAFSESQRSALVLLAGEYSILPEMAAALALAQQLELLRPDTVSPSMHLQAATRESRWILDHVHAQHLAQRFQPTQDGAGSWRLKRYEFGLRGGFAYRAEIVRRILLRPRVWARFDLPDALFPLYALLSPLEWILFQRRVPSPSVTSKKPSRWRRWRTLSREKQRLLAEAFVTLLLARLALAVVPMRRIFHWLEQPVSHNGAAPSSQPSLSHTAESIRWAILTVARYGPLSFVCFPQALAAHAMLRRRGIGSIMHYGVRRAADRTMRAHTWLEVDHRMLLGGESALLFAPIHSSGTHSKPT